MELGIFERKKKDEKRQKGEILLGERRGDEREGFLLSFNVLGVLES